MSKSKNGRGGGVPPGPLDTLESKAWSMSLSPPVTLGGSATLRRQSYGNSEHLRILKNLIMMGIAFALLFTAFMATANLQSSVNAEGNLGVYSLASIYGAFVISSLFVPPLLLAKLSTKWTLVLSITGYVTYIAAQFYPHFVSLIPASIFIGFSGAGLWTSQSNYVTKISEEYALMKGLNPEIVSQWFFGFFFLCFHSAQVWGNLVSSFVLSSDPGMKGSSTSGENGTVANLTHCGANFCPASRSAPPPNDTNGNLVMNLSQADNGNGRPAEVQMEILIGIFLVFSVVAALVIIIGVDSLKRYGEREGRLQGSKWYSLLIATVKHWGKPAQLLLIPIATWVGIQEAFLGAEFTLGFVSCALGIHRIGFVMTAFGISAATSSILLGKTAEYVGRATLFTLAGILNASVLVTLLHWEPSPEQPHIFFILAAAWGIADGVWSPQVRSMYGTIFRETREAAFSNAGLWLSVGFIIVYINAAMLCMSLKIYIYLAILGVTLICYFIVELKVRKEKTLSF